MGLLISFFLQEAISTTSSCSSSDGLCHLCVSVDFTTDLTVRTHNCLIQFISFWNLDEAIILCIGDSFSDEAYTNFECLSALA